MKLLRTLLILGILGTPVLAAENPYPAGPESQKQEGVPQGEIIKGNYTSGPKGVFPGTYRDYSVYIPQQLNRDTPAPLMVLQDGGGYQAVNVFNNLIAKKAIPPLVGIFIMHGRVKALSTNALDRFNRSYEYDGLGDHYARFLLEEFLPYIERQHGLKLTTNGNDRAIGGASSGAICAFTVAWERPDAFRRVYSSIGTYVGLRGGNNYPTLIRKQEPKPIRIFLQDGENDLNIYGGDWWMANQEMERSFQFSGYDVRHAWGTGAHDGNQATQVFPDALRWLWRDYPSEIRANPDKRSKQPVVREVLTEESDWQLVGSGYKFTEGPTANTKGEVFFSDIPDNRIYKVNLNGQVTVFAENTGGVSGLKFGPDGLLYATAHGRKQILVYDAHGKPKIVAKGVESNDLCITQSGDIYATDPTNRRVWLIKPNGTKRVVDEGVRSPKGIQLSPDQSLLYVADTEGQFVWSYQISESGALAFKQRYYHLHLVDGSSQSGANGMTVDRDGRLYVATEAGIQFCDQAGRVNGILSKPQNSRISNVAFGGPNGDELYVTCTDKVFKRKTRVQGVFSGQLPIKPAAPRL